MYKKVLKNLIAVFFFAIFIFSYNNAFAMTNYKFVIYPEYYPQVDPQYIVPKPTSDLAYRFVDINGNSSSSVSSNTSDNNSSPVKSVEDTTVEQPVLAKDIINANNLAARSAHGSNSFMPGSIWQWILVIFFILIIIIVARLLVKESEEPTSHN